MLEQLGPEAKELIVLSQDIAHAMGHGEMRGEHLLLALFERMDKKIASEFADIGITYEQLFSAVQADHPTKDSTIERELIEISPEVQIILVRSTMEAKQLGTKTILPKHIFIAFEWYGVCERGSFYAWELLKKSCPEHGLRKLFRNIEFCEPKIGKRKLIAKPKTNPKMFQQNDLFALAQTKAKQFQNAELEPFHLLLAFTEDKFAQEVFFLLAVDALKLRIQIEEKLTPRTDPISIEIQFDASVKRILERALKLARELNDDYLGSDLIFLAFVQIAKVENFRAWQILNKSWSIDIETLEKTIQQRIQDRKLADSPESRRDQPLFDWITAEDFDSKHEIIDAAKDAGLKHGHNKITTPYILFALSRTPDTVASKILDEIGLNPNKLDTLLLQKYGRGPLREKGEVLFTQAISIILDYAKEIASEANSNTIESEHILQAIVRMGKRFDGCVAWELICDTGKAERLESLLKDHSQLSSVTKEPEPHRGRTDFFSKTTVNLLNLAHAESQSLNNAFIEPEHLFLALQAMPSLDVLDVLKSLDLDIFKSRKIVEKITGQKKKKSNSNPTLSPATKNLLEEAFIETRRLGKSQVEPMHILLAIAKSSIDRDSKSVLVKTLNQLDLKSDLFVETIMKLIQQEVGIELKPEQKTKPKPFRKNTKHKLPENFSQTSLRVVEQAHKEANRFGYASIEPEHLLLGLVKETSNEVSSMFLSRNVTVKKLEHELSELKDRGSGGSSNLILGETVKEIIALASKEAEDLVEPTDLLGYLILSKDLTTINLLRGMGLEDLLEGANCYAPPVVLFDFLNKSNLSEYFVSESLKIIFRSQELARQCGHKYAGPEHLLIAILESHTNDAIRLLKSYGMTLQEVKKSFKRLVGIGKIYNLSEIPMSPNALEVLRDAASLVDELNSNELKLEHLLLSILNKKSGATLELLKDYELPADLSDQIVIALQGKSKK